MRLTCAAAEPFSAADHVAAIYEHTGDGLFDWMILNDQPIPRAVLARYRREAAMPVVNDRKRIAALGLNVFEDGLLARGRVVRHDPDLLAEAVLKAFCRSHPEGKDSVEEA